MRLKKLVQGILIICSVLVLSACTGSRNNDEVAVNDAKSTTEGAQTSGVGQGTSLDEQGGGGSQLASQRTYYFDFDRSDVHEEDKSAILANADYLAAHPGTKIVLEGHTDPRGSREYNIALGERRADAVLELMKSKGVSPGQIRVVSYGAQRLAVSGHTEEDYRLDRRALLNYSTN